MPTRWETYPIPLLGGLTLNQGRIEQGIKAPGSATTLQNYEPDIQGGYSRILGFQKFSDVEVPGTGLIRGVVAISSSKALAIRDGKYYYSEGAGWTEKLTLTDPVIVRARYETYNFSGEKVVLVDGVNPPAYFDVATSTMAYAVGAPSDVVGAKRVREFKSHLFFAKGTILSFSAPYLDQDFSVANGAGNINVGDEITGLIVFRDQLFIFCLNKIFRLAGNSVSDFSLIPVTSNTGCLCGDTIQEVGGDILYLGPDGVRYLSASERENDFGLVRASEKIQTKVTEVTSTDCIYSSVTIARKNQYRLFYYKNNVPVSNSRGFLATKYSNQSVDNIAWAEIKGMKIFTSSKFQDRDDETILFVSDGGYVFLMETGNSFDGADIEAIFETPYMPISDPKIRKTIYKHTLFAKPSGDLNIRCNLKFDYAQADSVAPPPFVVSGTTSIATYGGANTEYGISLYGGTAEEQFYNNVNGSGFVVAVRYYDKSQSPTYNLNFIVLEYRNHERR